MDTAQPFFRRRHARDDDEFLDKVQTYLAALTHNGQIVGEYMMAEVSGGVLVTAGIPEADALADRHANKWVRKSLRELAALGVARPKVTRLGENLERRPSCRCRKRPFLILFTTFLDAGPPLRCGACFGPVALYKVSTYEAGNQQDVLWWQHTYQAMDWLFIGSGPGERFANDQLSRVDSPLSTDGRELARELEKETRIHVYYYLSKHVGRRRNASACALHAAGRGCERSRCIESSTSSAGAVACCPTWRSMCG